MTRFGWCGLALAALAAAGCSAEPSAAQGDDAVWRKELAEHRAANEAEFRTGPASPLSAIERRALRGPGTTHVSLEPGAVRLTDQAGADTVLSFVPGGAGWSWQPARDGVAASFLGDDSPLAPGPIARPAVFLLGRFNLFAQTQGDSLVVMIHDSEREELRRFQGLTYFAPDRRFAVTAAFERWPEPETTTLPTTLRLEKSYRRYARLRFAIDGKSVELTAFAPAGGRPGALFVPFRDATSGESSYGGGRYLDLEEPKGDTLLVDFNRAYNPMCVYSTAYNCPIPPPENRLSVAIEAGQKSYAH